MREALSTEMGSGAMASATGRLAARAGWLVLAPLVLSWVSLRLLLPGRWEAGSGAWGWLARMGEQYPVAFAVGFFLLWSVLLRAFADRLPGAHHLVPAAALPRAISGTEGWLPKLIGWLTIVLGTAALALGLRTVVGQTYRVTSTSMLPTLEPADYLLVNKLAYARLPGRTRPAPQRGDIVVFPGHAVGAGDEDRLVKRVVGIPGDRVTVGAGLVQINGWQVPYCDAGRYVYIGQGQVVVGRLAVEFLEHQSYLTFHTPEGKPSRSFLVKPGEVFVIGDNRNASRDSREWADGRSAGVPVSAIEGRVERIVGFDRRGHLDPQRLLLRPGLVTHLPGMDAREVQARIARCLTQRPNVATPPAVSSL